MKLKIIEHGATLITAGAEDAEPEIRAALASGDGDRAVRLAIMNTTDCQRDTGPDEYITVTEDDGTVLWSGWLTGHDKPAPGAELERLRDACRLLGKVVHRDCRILEAARIEMHHNGPHAAMQWVLNSLDGVLDEDWGALKWDGTESAQEWFDRVCEADAVAAAADRTVDHVVAIERLLALPLPENDSGASTVRGYLVALLAELWRDPERFSGKNAVYAAMARDGFDGSLESVDDEAADSLILAAIERMGQ